MGKKYIIELEDKPVCVFDEDTQTFFPRLHRVKGFNSLVFDQNGLDKLTPYTEPDLDAIRKEAYDEGYTDAAYNCHERRAFLDVEKQESYRCGLRDAWEAARKIGSNSMCSLEEMGFDFSQCVVNDYNPSWFVVKNYLASECIEKIRQYEQEKEEQEEKDFVTTEEVMRRYLDTFCKRNFCTKCLLHTPDFTCGRGYHFLTKNPVSDEEVRRAYAKVVKE